jgi:argininosuccinate lyase
VKASVRIMAEIVAGMKVRRERMLAAAQDGYLNATDLADYLVGRGLAFRAAHEVAGRVVQFAIAQGKRIEELPMAQLTRFSSRIGKDVYKFLAAEAVVARRRALGGTARQNVLRRLKELRA